MWASSVRRLRFRLEEGQRLRVFGRMGIYELLPMTEQVGGLIRADCEVEELRRQAFKEGMRTLRLSGAQKVGAGLTTISEVLRVSPASQS